MKFRMGRKGFVYPLLAVILVVAIVGTLFTVINYYNAAKEKTEAEKLAIEKSMRTATTIQPGVTGGVPAGQCAGGTSVAMSGGGKDFITGAAADVNGALFYFDTGTNTWKENTGETRLNAAITSISSAFPVEKAAYLVIGNGPTQWTTDRGTDYYTRKVSFTSGCSAESLGFIDLYAMSSVTWNFYDDGTAETTANVTVGSGASYVKASIKLEAGDNQYIGSPDYYDPLNKIYPLGFCFNESTSGLLEYVKPKNYVSSFERPKFLIGKNIVGCYEVDIAPVKDQGISPEIPLAIKANTGQDPGVTNWIGVIPMDRCARIADNKLWEFGVWGDDSAEGTSYDCGIDGLGNALKINLA